MSATGSRVVATQCAATQWAASVALVTLASLGTGPLVLVRTLFFCARARFQTVTFPWLMLQRPQSTIVTCVHWKSPATPLKSSWFVSDVDECAQTGVVCDQNAVCTNTIGSFRCRCNPGFIGDGTTCSGENSIPVFVPRFRLFHLALWWPGSLMGATLAPFFLFDLV